MSDRGIIHFKRIALSQFEAALSMLRQCIDKCPPDHWDNPKNLIAKYPFWMVAYHVLCFTDLYLSLGDAQFAALLKERAAGEGPAKHLHPLGMTELDDEYPSRVFSKSELLAYVEVCHAVLCQTLGDGPDSETQESLQGPTGFARRGFSRAELHLYSLRHVQHHTGQLSAWLRKLGIDTGWIGTGWK